MQLRFEPNMVFIWASTWDNLSSGLCQQQRRRPHCASVQSIWSAPLLFAYWKVSSKRNFTILACLFSWAAWLWYDLIGNPKEGGEGSRTTKGQTSLHILAVWSAPLLFPYWKVSYQNMLKTEFHYSSLSL